MKNYSYITSKLNTKILIQSRSEISDLAGGFETTWIDKFEIYGGTNDVQKSYSDLVGNKSTALSLYNIVIRDCNILIEDRVKIDDVFFKIISINNTLKSKGFIELICQEFKF